MPRPAPPKNLAIFCSPERYVQGRDATAELGAQMKELKCAGPVLIVAGASAARLLADAWAASLGAAGYEHTLHPFPGECTQAEIDAIAGEARRRGCRTIVGAGGGKVIDAARAAATEALSGVNFVSCPTVASSDAPCSALSVVYTAEGEVERYLFYSRHPVLVLVDTAVIARAPRRTLVSGFGDALATFYEARTVCGACAPNFFGGRSTATGLALARLSRDILFEDGAAALDALAGGGGPTPAFERVVEVRESSIGPDSNRPARLNPTARSLETNQPAAPSPKSNHTRTHPPTTHHHPRRRTRS
jgi:glycerol dehydrogenase